jgi:DNA-binding SARP family transcriptional activator
VFFEAMMACPDTRLGIARDEDGAILGFSSAIAVCQEALPILESHPLSAAVLPAFKRHMGLSELPRTAEDSNIYYLFHLAHLDRKADAVRAALIRSQFGIFALGGVYLVATPIPFYKKMFEALGFGRIAGAESSFYGTAQPCDSYVLDLSRGGVEGWIESFLSPSHELRIQLLGRFRLSVGGQSVPDAEWRLRKAKALVKLLALAPGHHLHREQVMDALWPEMGMREAANNFHQALHTARQALASVADGQCKLTLKDQMLSLEWPWGIQTDVERFEHAANEARGGRDASKHQRAADLYAAELLPEDRYEDWCAAKRDALRDVYVGLLSDVAALQEASGQLAAAIAAHRQILEADPLDESANAALVRLYGESGRPREAARQREELRRLVDEGDAGPLRAR